MLEFLKTMFDVKLCVEILTGLISGSRVIRRNHSAIYDSAIAQPKCDIYPSAISQSMIWGNDEYGLDCSKSFDNLETDSCSESSILGAGSELDGSSLKTSDDQMTQLLNFQRSNGTFKISPENWIGSIFEVYAGSYEDVRSRCPAGIKITLWITALAIKILELKLGEKRDLWELVEQKSIKYIFSELKQNKLELNRLLTNAEEYIMNT